MLGGAAEVVPGVELSMTSFLCVSDPFGGVISNQSEGTESSYRILAFGAVHVGMVVGVEKLRPLSRFTSHFQGWTTSLEKRLTLRTIRPYLRPAVQILRDSDVSCRGTFKFTKHETMQL